jgi:ribose transport system substrate-binding protein
MFDASDMQKEALKNGHVDSLVVQNPFNQGYYGIKIAVAGLRGKPYEKSIDTGVILVTRENFDDPVVREWTSPDIKKYLGE